MTPKSCLHLVSASPRFWAARVEGGREDAENGMDFYEVVDFYIIARSPVGPGRGKGKRAAAGGKSTTRGTDPRGESGRSCPRPKFPPLHFLAVTTPEPLKPLGASVSPALECKSPPHRPDGVAVGILLDAVWEVFCEQLCTISSC